ncbi:MAG: transporter ATP-binding protein [Chloroflexi bacterium]|nr:transporter ATP-binding protein [Chloroflexota bacterium]
MSHQHLQPGGGPQPTSGLPLSDNRGGWTPPGPTVPLNVPPKPRLLMLTGEQVGREYLLTNRVTTIGRSASNDIVIADPRTSRRHVEVIQENGQFWAVDAGSANGFYVNDQQVQRAQLQTGDLITIGLVRMAFQVGTPAAPGPDQTGPSPVSTVMLDPQAVNQILNQANLPPGPALIDENNLQHIDLRFRPVTSFGRDQAGNELLLDNPQVSRRHLQISHRNGVFTATDLNSTNGTYVNGQRIQSVIINDGDIINIGPYRFMFAQGFLHRSQEDEGVRIDVLNLSKQVSPSLTLLQNLTFTILPREFVAIVGVSGSGKSTLMDAISGVRPATGGTVLYNKAEYYSQMEVYRSSIGYVPQDDIVPTELTVSKALYYAAKLRLPQDTTEPEIQERLDEVIDDLDLELRRDTPIQLLSGGQRKRVSIGSELLSKPTLFFLDEPTSGLDPGLEERMMQFMRKLADQGRTVVLITHATQNVELCDKVLFLARGGYMAFYGSPREAFEYFGVNRFSEIYVKLEQEATPQEWTARFTDSAYYQRNVVSRLRAISNEANRFGALNIPADPSRNMEMPVQPPVVFRKSRRALSAPRQFLLLVRRYFEILTKDRKNLLILLLQSPLIALMLTLVFNRNDFGRPGGDYGSAKTLIFLLVIVSVWLGTSNAAREIVKEASIYRRERRIGLKLAPYILSKLTVQTGLVLIQIAMLVGIVWAGVGLGALSVESIGYLYLTLVLTALAGVTLGLLISSMTSNSDRATSFVPVVLIPQIIFSGAVVALERMGAVGEWFSNLMISKWGYQATGRLLSLDTIPSTRVRFNGPPPDQAGRIEALFPGSLFFDQRTFDWYLIPKRNLEFTSDVFLNWGILVLFVLVGLGLILLFQLRKDRRFTR